jgi:hypothetical protein
MRLPVLEAVVTLMPGPSPRRVGSGYRPAAVYSGDDGWTAIFHVPDGGSVVSGEPATVLLEFLEPWRHRDRIQPGDTFELREGSHAVGSAVAVGWRTSAPAA